MITQTPLPETVNPRVSSSLGTTLNAFARVGPGGYAAVSTLIATVTAVAAVLVALAGTQVRELGAAADLTVVALLLLLATQPLLHLRLGRDRVLLVWTEAAVLVGLATLPPPVLVLALGPLFGLGQLLGGHPRRRAAYNAATTTVSVAGAVAVHALTDDLLSYWPALLAAVLVYAVANLSLTSLAVSISQRMRYRAALLPSVSTWALVLLLNVACGVGVLLAHRSPELMVAAPAWRCWCCWSTAPRPAPCRTATSGVSWSWPAAS